MSGHDLSHITYKAADHSHANDRVAIVVSKWNSEITEVLYQGALAVLIKANLSPDHISLYPVPGAYELPFGAQFALNKQKNLDGVICLGCVIQGETRHFDFISEAVAQGIMRVGLEANKPVIFGVSTPDNMEQALARAGGKYGNKGEEAAVALLEMLDMQRKA